MQMMNDRIISSIIGENEEDILNDQFLDASLFAKYFGDVKSCLFMSNIIRIDFCTYAFCIKEGGT